MRIKVSIKRSNCFRQNTGTKWTNLNEAYSNTIENFSSMQLLNFSKFRSYILTNLFEIQIRKMKNSKKKFMSNQLRHISMINHQNLRTFLKDHLVRKMRKRLNSSATTKKIQFWNQNGKRIRRQARKRINSEKKVSEKFSIPNFHQIKKRKDFNLKKDTHLICLNLSVTLPMS